MGLFDFLTSTKRPASGTPVLSELEVRQRLLSANRSTAPWRVIDGQSEKVDYIVEWKVSDPEWIRIFKKAHVTRVFRVFLKLIPADRLVRAMDREYKVEWSAQADPLAVSVSLSATLDSFKGQKHEISFGGPVAFRERYRRSRPMSTASWRTSSRNRSKSL